MTELYSNPHGTFELRGDIGGRWTFVCSCGASKDYPSRAQAKRAGEDHKKI